MEKEDSKISDVSLSEWKELLKTGSDDLWDAILEKKCFRRKDFYTDDNILRAIKIKIRDRASLKLLTAIKNDDNILKTIKMAGTEESRSVVALLEFVVAYAKAYRVVDKTLVFATSNLRYNELISKRIEDDHCDNFNKKYAEFKEKCLNLKPENYIGHDKIFQSTNENLFKKIIDWVFESRNYLPGIKA